MQKTAVFWIVWCSGLEEWCRWLDDDADVFIATWERTRSYHFHADNRVSIANNQDTFANCFYPLGPLRALLGSLSTHYYTKNRTDFLLYTKSHSNILFIQKVGPIFQNKQKIGAIFCIYKNWVRFFVNTKKIGPIFCFYKQKIGTILVYAEIA